MNITPIDTDFSITQQIQHTDLEALAGLGFKTVINNRPDHEQAGQPQSKDLEKAAKKVGIDYHHIPIIPGKATAEDVSKFSKAIAASEGNVLAFCKSGMRAKSLYSACQPAQQKSGLFSGLFGKK